VRGRLAIRTLVLALAASVLPTWALVAQQEAAEAAGDEPLRVLFVGNSLTSTNELPAVVAALAEAMGRPPLEYRSLTKDDYGLEDHWRSGRVEKALEEERWDVVVMQQGPSSTEKNQANLAEWSGKLAEMARAHGARPALYMVWPSAERFVDFADVITSYGRAAEATGADLYPVGAAWLAAWQLQPKMFLYSRDGFHPSAQGTTLAAMVIAHGLYGALPEELPKGWEVSGWKVSPKEGAILLRAAEQVMTPHQAVPSGSP
jgi:lysophospholipase L1-like esterase